MGYSRKQSDFNPTGDDTVCDGVEKCNLQDATIIIHSKFSELYNGFQTSDCICPPPPSPESAMILWITNMFKSRIIRTISIIKLPAFDLLIH